MHRNTAAGGGAVYCNYDAEVSIIGSTFTENVATSAGGGVFADSQFSASGFDDFCQLTLEQSTFIDNFAEVSGGGVGLGRGTWELSEVTLIGNHAEREAGGAIRYGGTLSLTDGVLESNTANWAGVAIGGELASQGATLLRTRIAGIPAVQR